MWQGALLTCTTSGDFGAADISDSGLAKELRIDSEPNEGSESFRWPSDGRYLHDVIQV